jgi:acetylornithine deacetylase/succinyl-diaminopimelate desuccinylase-like protein
MKSIDAVWIDSMVRLRAEKQRPRRTVKMALTCGEETSGAFNGAQWLSNNRRALIDADFALNEGGGGVTNGKALSDGGRLVVNELQVGESLSGLHPDRHQSRRPFQPARARQCHRDPGARAGEGACLSVPLAVQ